MALDARELMGVIEDYDPTRPLAMQGVLEPIRQALGSTNVICYTPEPGAEHWDLAMCEWVGPGSEESGAAHRTYIRSFASEDWGFAAYDPYAVQLEQRNRMLSEDELAKFDPNALYTHHRLYGAIRKSERHQLRALFCEGPRLLAWFGAVSSEPFTPEQREVLEALRSPLHRLFKLGRDLGRPGRDGVLLDTLLDQMQQPAFVLYPNGVFELANRAGEQLLGMSHSRHELERLRDAVRARTPCTEYRITALRSPGMPLVYLALRVGSTKVTALALERASTLWKLRPKALRVLDLLCSGMSNKEIADAMTCAEVTVEKHMSALFRASGARSRSDLVARVHRL